MRTILKLRFVLLGVFIVLISCGGNQKVKNAERSFCKHLSSFDRELDALLDASEAYDSEAFNKAFEKADKGWAKLVKSAEKLEEVQMQQSINEYNKLVDKVNKIAGDPKNEDILTDIGNNIEQTAEKIAAIQSTVCNLP